MTTESEVVRQYKCPNCGGDSIFLSPVLDLFADPEWFGYCCKCRHKDKLDQFLVTSKRVVNYSITSKYIN